ncbi:hypothetical protein ACGFJ7_27865 [Actinoplanes sp. NPDC048988]|uniref:hypothetical protein n=1 Tax=Actinoplanes sp. NPDC048988 TaxID=3363901 RepID=UPI0037221582
MGHERPHADTPKWKAFQLWTGILCGALALSVTSQVIVSSTRGDVRDRATVIQRTWPQEWSFFSRYRDAPIIRAYRNTGGASTVNLTARAESVGDAGGFRRLWMSQLIERGYLARSVPAQAWTTCRSHGLECVRSASTRETFEVENSVTHRTLCGDMILLRSPSVERAFRRDLALPADPSGALEVARVQVICGS